MNYPHIRVTGCMSVVGSDMVLLYKGSYISKKGLNYFGEGYLHSPKFLYFFFKNIGSLLPFPCSKGV